MKPAIAFATSLHPVSEPTVAVCNRMLASVLRLENCSVTLVVDDDSRIRSNDPRVAVMRNYATPPSQTSFAKTHRDPRNEHIRLDRGLKLVRAIDVARRQNPEAIAIIDSDDLVHRDFLEMLYGTRQITGVVQTSGPVWNSARNDLRMLGDFHAHCGSCHVVKAAYWDFPKLDNHRTQAEVLDTLGYQQVLRLLGSHHYRHSYFELSPIRNLFCYHIGHGHNSTQTLLGSNPNALLAKARNVEGEITLDDYLAPVREVLVYVSDAGTPLPRTINTSEPMDMTVKPSATVPETP